MKVLLLGANGQLGGAFTHNKGFERFHTLCLSKTDLDITNYAVLETVCLDFKPDVVINCAAYTQVDNAEQNADLCFLINTHAVEQLAKLCARLNCLFVQFSTDYVFDGTQNTPYTEDDMPNPINIYGLSKFHAEIAVKKSCNKYLILRTSWLFSEFGHNFYLTMRKLAFTGRDLKIVADEVGNPTYAPWLSDAVISILMEYEKVRHIEYGVYHLCGDTSLSWYEFARLIFNSLNLNVEIDKTSAQKWQALAKRPSFSVLNSEKAKRLFNIPPLLLDDALKRIQS